jgi:hypothetical protein
MRHPADGPLRFVFVVDSASDPAVPVVRELLAQRKQEVVAAAAAWVDAAPGAARGQRALGMGRQQGVAPSGAAPATPQRYSLRPRRGAGAQEQQREEQAPHRVQPQASVDALVVSGPATHCSQKIHK